MKAWFKLLLVGIVLALYAAIGWAVGLGVCCVWIAISARRFIRTRRALAPTIPCQWCHEPVDQFGSFACRTCRARTLGWAWRCPVCAAWAGHIECPHCGLSVTNPILGAP